MRVVEPPTWVPLRPVPALRPFRALRYGSSSAPDLGAVLCPPYDVISAEERAALAARDPHNAVRLELPEPPPGGVAEERYREAARTLVAWRTNGVLRKDRVPAIYIYEQLYTLPGTDEQRRQRGFFVRLKLEPYGPSSGVRRHESTLSAPKADRYQLLKACGANFSAVAALYRGGRGITEPCLDRLTARAPDAAGVDGSGVAHRLWVAPAGLAAAGAAGTEARLGEGAVDPADPALTLVAAASRGPLTIADGHHRYETALAYQAERGRNRACESDPAYDYTLALLFDVDEQPPTVLPTHRLVHGGPTGGQLLDALGALFGVHRVRSREALMAAFAPGPAAPARRGGTGTARFGVWSGGVGALLRIPASDPEGPDLAWRLDVSRLGRTLESVFGIDGSAVAGGGRLSYSHDARESLDRVDAGQADSAFLLDPTPVDAVLDVAAAGGVMPQKSTFFYPKAASGLVFNPLEW